ncbi:MAG: hypothetical protein J6Q24_02505 [Clostridia bacterium]|nr:hypothetical protein [Clostridia bacterium]
MDNLTLEVIHTKELFCRFTLHRVAVHKRRSLVLAIFSGVLSILLIAGNIFFNETMHTLEAGILFAAVCVTSSVMHGRLTPRAIARMIEKNIEAYPLRSKYTFFDDKFIVETDFTASHNTTEYEYSAIARVYIVDERTMYLMFRNNTFCAIESEKCGNITAWLSSKVMPGRFENAININGRKA